MRPTPRPAPPGSRSCSPAAASGTRRRTCPSSTAPRLRSTCPCWWRARRRRGASRAAHGSSAGSARTSSPTLYARAAVFAAPSTYEPFGLAALEAGLAGCALVLGDLPSLREVWGDAALYVDPRDDEALAAAVRVALAQPELGEAARERARAYTPERMARGYLELYERLTVVERPETALR